MKKTRTIISANLNSFKEFEYYFLHLDKIVTNISLHPDIAIETCKSLIEGVSKSILNKLDNTFDEKKAATGRNPKSVQQLFKMALNKIAEQNEDFEIGYVHSSGQIINITSEIRTERGDISHGKSVPKQINSTSEFAKLVSEMTDLTVSYVLKSFFEIDFEYKEKLDYESDKMKKYNEWLDENTDFPIKKAKYSQLLFENDYDEYESRYSDEFLKTDEIEEDEEVIEVEPKTEQKEKEIEKLVGTFDEDAFWTDENKKKTITFSKTENLNNNELRDLINNYFYSGKTPIRDDVAKAMNEKPPLIERIKRIDALILKIVTFADELKKDKKNDNTTRTNIRK